MQASTSTKTMEMSPTPRFECSGTVPDKWACTRHWDPSRRERCLTWPEMNRRWLGITVFKDKSCKSSEQVPKPRTPFPTPSHELCKSESFPPSIFLSFPFKGLKTAARAPVAEKLYLGDSPRRSTKAEGENLACGMNFGLGILCSVVYPLDCRLHNCIYDGYSDITDSLPPPFVF
jgi:hypothetical protein